MPGTIMFTAGLRDWGAVTLHGRFGDDQLVTVHRENSVYTPSWGMAKQPWIAVLSKEGSL